MLKLSGRLWEMTVLVSLSEEVDYRKKTLPQQELGVFTMVKYTHITEHIRIKRKHLFLKNLQRKHEGLNMET